MDKMLRNKIEKRIEQLNWNIYDCSCDDDCIEWELSHYTEAGEDFNIYVIFKTIEGLSYKLYNLYANFDREEQVKRRLDSNVSGVFDVETLVKDIKYIDDKLKELWCNIDEFIGE